MESHSSIHYQTKDGHLFGKILNKPKTCKYHSTLHRGGVKSWELGVVRPKSPTFLRDAATGIIENDPLELESASQEDFLCQVPNSEPQQGILPDQGLPVLNVF